MPREGNIVLPGRTVTVRCRWLNGRVPTPSVPLVHPVHRFAHHEIDFRRRIVTMAVVNRTPDSFYDDGAGAVLEDARAAGQACTGVDLAGLGVESVTRTEHEGGTAYTALPAPGGSVYAHLTDVQDGARRAEGDGGRERDSPDPALGAGVLEEPDLRVAAVGRGEAPVPPSAPQADDHERAADHEGQ